MSALFSTNHALMLAQKPVADHARTTQQSTVTTRTPHKQNQHVKLLIQQSDCITYRNTVQAVHPSEPAKHSELMGITHQGQRVLVHLQCKHAARLHVYTTAARFALRLRIAHIMPVLALLLAYTVKTSHKHCKLAGLPKKNPIAARSTTQPHRQAGHELPAILTLRI